MLLALCTLPGKEDEPPRLSMVPDKIFANTTPVNLAHVIVTESVIQYLSPDEGFTVKKVEDGFTEIEALQPAKLYLTPNLPSRPGFSVNKIKFKIIGENRYEVHFDRNRGWDKWEPNDKVY